MNFKGKFWASVLLRYSFVRVVSFSFVPNIEMNSIYYDVLKLNWKPVNEKTMWKRISINTAMARFETVFFIPVISPLGYKPLRL